MAAVQGLDVSAIQGTLVPYTALYALGHSFVFVRCQVGNNVGRDTIYQDNIRRAKDAGLFVTPYCFPFPLPHLDPIEQADLFLKSSMFNGHPVGSNIGEMPQAFDLEWPPPEEWQKRKCTADQIVDWALAALERMHLNTGQAPIIYSYPYFLQMLAKAKNFPMLLKYKLWIAGGAQYVNGNGRVPDLAVVQPPKVVGWGTNWLFWQWDGNGGKKLPEIGMDADFNVFNGQLFDLARLCQSNEAVDLVITPEDISVMHAEASSIIMDDELHAYRQARANLIISEAA